MNRAAVAEANGTMRALVLSGGAARGAYEAGVASTLLQHEIFDVICGTSVGALNGALIAQGDAALLGSAWHELAARKVLSLRPELQALRSAMEAARHANVFSALNHLRKAGRLKAAAHFLGLLDQGVLRSIMLELLSFDRLKISYVACATNLTHGTSDAFYAFTPALHENEIAFREAEDTSHCLTRENFMDAVMASAALPVAFEPVPIEVEGKTCLFADGCISNNSPLRQAIHAGATHVTLVLLQHSALRYRDHRIEHIGHVSFISQDIQDERFLRADLKLARAINDHVRLGVAPGKRFVDIRVIGPSVPLRIGGFQLNDQSKIDSVFELGASDARAAVGTAPKHEATHAPG